MLLSHARKNLDLILLHSGKRDTCAKMDERLQEGLALITAALAGPSTSSDPSSSTSSRRGGSKYWCLHKCKCTKYLKSKLKIGVRKIVYR